MAICGVAEEDAEKGDATNQNVPQGLKRVLKKSPRGEKTYLSG
jgi:hypothetical protein